TPRTAHKDGRVEITRGTNRLDGRNWSGIDILVRPLTHTNEVWRGNGVEVSDATGNVAQNSSISWGDESAGFSFQPSLWPEEKAWKLKLEIKRTRGFRPNELLVFKNVPLGELNSSNRIGWSTNVADVRVTLQDIYRP